MKKILALLIVLNFTACAELQQVVNQLPQSGGISDLDIAGGLREALDLLTNRSLN